jgi:hypothetical protein
VRSPGGGNDTAVKTWRAVRIGAVLLAAVSVASVLSGCADGGGRRDAVSRVALGLLSAVADGDGAAACADLAPGTAAEVASTAGQDCAAAILDEHLPAPAAVSGVDVYGQWARVVLADDTVFLAAFPGGWRVVAAGCQSRGERPYDCTVQGG